MSTLFTKIIRGEIPSYKVYEDDSFFAFLTIEPLSPGHTLLVPKREVDKWTELTDEEIKAFFIVAKNLAIKLEKKFEVKRVGVIVAGFMVPHVHIHLIPCNEESELNFTTAKKATEDELVSVLRHIVAS